MSAARWPAAVALATAPMAADAEPVSLYAAGSLTMALGRAAADFASAYNVEVAPTLGPSA